MDLTNKIEPGTEKELDEVGARVFEDVKGEICPLIPDLNYDYY